MESSRSTKNPNLSQLEYRDLGFRAEANRQTRGADPVADVEVPPGLLDVPAGVVRAEARRGELVAQDRDVDLRAVRVTRERERHRLRHAREQVWVVREEQDRRAVRDL